MSELYEDLLQDSSESFEDGNYFLVTITELELEQEYPVEFRWKFKDGSFGQWGPVKTLNSQSKTTPVAPNLDSADVEGGAGFIKVTWGGLAGGVTAVDFDRVNIYISGGSFGDGTKPAGFFKKAETRTFIAEPGLYIVVLKIQTVNGAESSASISRSVTVKPIEEQVQAPVTPKGFSSERVLGGIQVNWDGTYTGNAEWYGFQAINIYAGTSASATGGTYIKVGQMTANKTTNKIVVPVDGTYVRYNTPVYIHASSVNKATPPVESSIVANVTSQSLGARSAISSDLADQIITNAKLVDDAVTAAKIATSAITETKIANDAVTTPKLVANAITADKIVSSAITADKIATNAVTATKILAGTIDVTKLSAGTISVNNLESGTLSATSFIRAGTAGSSRIEISSAAVPASSILAGLYIYNGGTAVLQAPLGGGLTITGSLTATQISTSSGKFAVSTGGVLTATDVDLTGQIKATTGYIGSSNGASGWTITSSGFQSTSGSVVLNGTTGSISGATITGAIITTTGGNSYGAVRMNTNTDAFEFLYSGSVVGSLYTFNAGNEILIQRGSPTVSGYATNTGFISISSTGLSLGRTNASGILTTGFSIDGSSPSITALAGAGGFIVSGGPIYTGTNTTTATDQSEGISLTQGGTLSARRSNANPLNLHRFNVTAATTTSVAVIDFYRNGTARGTLEIFGNTSAPVLVGSSDYRLKENIRDYTGGLDKILATKVRIFNEIEDEDKNDIVGFVAHEFSETFPDFVSGEKDEIDLEGNPIYQKLSHSNIAPYLVSAIQELSKRLDELEG